MVSDLIIYENYAYFEDFKNDEIHRMSLDGSNHIILFKSDSSINSFNVYKDSIYLSIGMLDEQLLKISLSDTSDVTLLTQDSVDFINIIDNYIYYINYSDNKRLYRIKTDGTERTGL